MSWDKAYEPQKFEADIYKMWEESGAFKPTGTGEKFVISIPPPNATGQLHVGHALMLAIEDAFVRFARMQGKDTLWIPGTDHAAIATNAIMEKQLAAEGKTKHDVGRDEFLRRLHEFIDASKGTIRSQIRSMGASTDWSRERYTMDPTLNRMVNEVFAKMYQDGLIYRGHRIVNWDPKLETTVSDDEVEHKTEKAPFYVLQYGPFQIGTARPETKFGDKYVVVHPDDERYRGFKHGQTFECEWINGKITATVIKDEAIDMNFGTGAMTITPWHDTTDFDIAERHNLEKQPIIDFTGKLLDVAGEFSGMHIAEARPKIVEKLQSKGLLVSQDDKYVHNIAVNSRGNGIIEPQIMQQWFINVNTPTVDWKGSKHSLKQVMQDVVGSGDIKITPERFEKVYFHWIDNLRDWCISRQIWWGHQIPVWYRGDEEYVGITAPQGDGWQQDQDTLDTWFSSALWTWSTLVDPQAAGNTELTLEQILAGSPDFQKYHPTTLMETGYDILFFWVARMIMMTTYATGQIPFETVYLHGLIRTADGKKMSKSSPETAIDPLDIIPKYGADALRLAMIIGLSPGNDLRLYNEKIEGYRNFCNKLWNVARFVTQTVGEEFHLAEPQPQSLVDEWILGKLAREISRISTLISQYRLSDAGQAVYSLLWDDFADWYIEASKAKPNLSVLAYGLETILKLAHPFAPYVTEAIYQNLPWHEGLLISSNWPEAPYVDQEAVNEFDDIQKLIIEIRSVIHEAGLSEPRLLLQQKHSQFPAALVARLANLSGVDTVEQGRGLRLTSSTYTAWLDITAEEAKNYLDTLQKRRLEQERYLGTLNRQLDNAQFVQSAPAEIVADTRSRQAQAQMLLSTIDEQIQRTQTAQS